MSWYNYIPGVALANAAGIDGEFLKKIGLNGASESDEEKMRRLNQAGAAAQDFAGQAQQNYGNMTGRLNGSLDSLQALANGQNSVSALQLKQAQQQNLASQRSMAAGAAPGNAAMAARGAAMNMGRIGYGLAGQQAVAGLQERNQAQQAYANMLGQARGQDMQGALGGLGTAVSAYGGGLNGQRDPTLAQQWMPIAQNVAKVAGM
jgi:hypothetical protein